MYFYRKYSNSQWNIEKYTQHPNIQLISDLAQQSFGSERNSEYLLRRITRPSSGFVVGSRSVRNSGGNRPAIE
jgi:hypothetical protein